MRRTCASGPFSAWAICLFLVFGSHCSAQTESGVLGARRYLQFCASCHGSDGQGGDKGPSLATSERVKADTDEDLFQVIHNGTQEGMPPFAQIGDRNIEVLVRFLRLVARGSARAAQIAPDAPPGDFESGRALFFGKGQCSTCHMMQGKGGFLASDLTHYGRGRDPAVVLHAITNPSAPPPPAGRVVTVTTDKGQTLTGLIRNEDNFCLDLQTQDGRYHSLDRLELKNVSYSDQSLMPRDYGEKLSASELNDLVGFLMVTGEVSQPTSGRDTMDRDR